MIKDGQAAADILTSRRAQVHTRRTHMQAHTYTHTHTHTQTHASAHPHRAHMHTHAHTCKRTPTHMQYTHARTHTHTHTHTHMQTHTHTKHTCTHTHACTKHACRVARKQYCPGLRSSKSLIFKFVVLLCCTLLIRPNKAKTVIEKTHTCVYITRALFIPVCMLLWQYTCILVILW